MPGGNPTALQKVKTLATQVGCAGSRTGGGGRTPDTQPARPAHPRVAEDLTEQASHVGRGATLGGRQGGGCGVGAVSIRSPVCVVWGGGCHATRFRNVLKDTSRVEKCCRGGVAGVKMG